MLNKKSKITLQQIKQEIQDLKGKAISFSVNQGRKRFVDFEGTIEQTYSSIFVVKIKKEENNALNELKEVLKGEIDLNEKREAEEKPFLNPIEIAPATLQDLTKTFTYIDILCGNFKINQIESQSLQDLEKV